MADLPIPGQYILEVTLHSAKPADLLPLQVSAPDVASHSFLAAGDERVSRFTLTNPNHSSVQVSLGQPTLAGGLVGYVSAVASWSGGFLGPTKALDANSSAVVVLTATATADPPAIAGTDTHATSLKVVVTSAKP